ncbi:MAG: hypothetical protein NC201_05665 [Prevotella sp.]|nr:hypothetical protein [Bacteroides sp.]MCM1366720.1 hypothetical protein [Prevotella sp.]MCM1437266.1 hypothetical protein [Prevotella sp.]
MRNLLFILLTIATLFAFPISAADNCNVSKKDSIPAGKYFWIPDSLADDVKTLLNGDSRVVKLNEEIDPNEKVIVNGDTVNVIIPSRNLGRFERGLYNYLYIPQGQWSFGLTVSYGEFSSEDLQLLDLITDCNFSGHSFSIKPYIAYFIRPNVSLGMRIGYTSTSGTLGSFNVDIDEDLSFQLHDVKYSSESYTAAVQARQYIGLGRRSRFAVYNEVELAFSSGNSDFTRPYDGIPKLTHSTNMDARITFSPGLSVLMMKNVSFNISFGVFGYYIHNERQIVDGVRLGDRFTSGANFRFNIFNINFGLSVNM